MAPNPARLFVVVFPVAHFLTSVPLTPPLNKTRELYLMSRTTLGEDTAATGDFLREFVQTQMFEW